MRAGGASSSGYFSEMEFHIGIQKVARLPLSQTRKLQFKTSRITSVLFVFQLESVVLNIVVRVIMLIAGMFCLLSDKQFIRRPSRSTR